MNAIIKNAVLSLTLLSTAYGTAQAPDYLVSGTNREAIHSNPLEQYFDKFPDKRPKTGLQSSALWRGYIGHFEIRDGELVVNDILIEKRDDAKRDEPVRVSVLKDVLPDERERKLDWFTGFLILPRGKVMQYIHMGYASVFESYRILFIKNGKVAADRLFTAEEYLEYKKLQFHAFRTSDRFKRMKMDLDSKYGDSEFVSVDNFLFIFDVGFPVETLIDYKDFRPNKSPEPTPTAVTPRADERKAK